jgi:hypothetical protein
MNCGNRACRLARLNKPSWGVQPALAPALFPFKAKHHITLLIGSDKQKMKMVFLENAAME